MCPDIVLLFREQAVPANIIVCSNYYCLPHRPHPVRIPPYPCGGKAAAMQAATIHCYILIRRSGVYMPSEPFHAYRVLGNYGAYCSSCGYLSEKGIWTGMLANGFLPISCICLCYAGCSSFIFFSILNASSVNISIQRIIFKNISIVLKLV